MQWLFVCVRGGGVFMHTSRLLLLYTQIFASNNFDLRLKLCVGLFVCVCVCAGDSENQHLLL